MAGAGLFWEKSIVGCLLVADLFWEKSTTDWWLISQTNRASVPSSLSSRHVSPSPVDFEKRSLCRSGQSDPLPCCSSATVAHGGAAVKCEEQGVCCSRAGRALGADPTRSTAAVARRQHTSERRRSLRRGWRRGVSLSSGNGSGVVLPCCGSPELAVFWGGGRSGAASGRPGGRRPLSRPPRRPHLALIQ
jgi:hypothetical protein